MSKGGSFSFVHCADLHLDSPFEGIHAIEPAIASALREATFRAFESVVSLAIQNRADFLIVAGDVYDGEDRSLRAQLRFRDGLRRAAENGIPCFIAHGNHDPRCGWEADLSLPEGIHRFSGERAERVPVRKGGDEIAHLYGISYAVRETRANLTPGLKRDPGGPFAIGVLHCNVGGDPNHDNYAPCTLDDLTACGMDYWALGHIHARRILRSGDPCVVYSGNTQGRSVRETGERGCSLVRVDGDRLEHRFVAADAVRWSVRDLDIAELGSADDLIEALHLVRERSREEADGRASVLRLRLTGRGALHAVLRRPDSEAGLLQTLREGESERADFVWVESLHAATRPALDVEALRRSESFLGDFLRAAQSLRDQPNAHQAMLDRFSERDGHRLVRDEIEHIAPGEMLDLLEAAENLGLDHLCAEEG